VTTTKGAIHDLNLSLVFNFNKHQTPFLFPLNSACFFDPAELIQLRVIEWSKSKASSNPRIFLISRLLVSPLISFFIDKIYKRESPILAHIA